MKKKVLLVIGVVIFIILAAGSVGDSGSSSSSAGSSSKKTAEVKEEEMGKIGEPFVTNHFEVTVSGIKAVDSQKIDVLTSLDKEEGVKYLIISVSAKNISAESKSLISAGKLILGDGEDKIEIANDETLLSEGYGAFLEEVNPKISKKTKLVYKIPADYADKTIIWDAFGSDKFIKLQ